MNLSVVALHAKVSVVSIGLEILHLCSRTQRIGKCLSTWRLLIISSQNKYVLMENVVDLLKFSAGFLGRYALSFLVCRKYQARLGIMAARCYGLPQFRLRVFLWGAHAIEKLPQFPLPMQML